MMATIAASLPAQAAPVTWPNTFLARVEAEAIVQTMNGNFLASNSATLTLEQWCNAHHLAGTDAKIKAHLIRDAVKPITPEQRARLKVGPDEKINYRHVDLVCGDHTLSIADNWYVPSRLTAEMNKSLETTDTPFGKAVMDLHFYRQNFSDEVLWHPLPQGWDMQKRPASTKAPMPIPQELVQHRALLFTKDGMPFCEVRETYQKEMLAFPLPR
jgi:chorismate-pyruvate lyase